MSVQDVQTRPWVVVTSSDGADKVPIANRLAKFPGLADRGRRSLSQDEAPLVKIVGIWNDIASPSLSPVDGIASLTQIDPTDERLPFYVETGIGTDQHWCSWVYNVNPVVSPGVTPDPHAWDRSMARGAAERSLSDRIDRAGGSHARGTRVVVERTRDCDVERYLWRTGTLISVDPSDPELTFTVRFDDGLSRWVHQVCPIPTAVEEPSETPAPQPETSDADKILLQQQVASLQRQVATLEQARFDRDREIGKIAMRYAREHGWCGVVNTALDEMGITAPESPRLRYTVTRTVTVTARPTAKNAEDVDRSWVKDSMRGWGDTGWLDLDSDWDQDSLEIEDDDISVDIVEVVEED